MHPYHKEILDALVQSAAEENLPLQQGGSRYIGTAKPVYFLPTAAVRKIFSGFAERHPHLTPAELIGLLDSLSQGETYNEYVAVGLLLSQYKKLRAVLDPHGLERWLEHAQGWAEVDTICQLNYTAAEMLADWDTWQALLSAFSVSENVHIRRASLVLLTKPLRESGDARLAGQAFANVEQLKGEKAILITKAVSWILRSLIKFHRSALEKYLEEQADTLPKIALRETRYKLAHGVKNKK